MLRGVAVIAMIVFHFLFDYNFFVIRQFDLYSGIWFWVGRFAATVFVFLAGISLVLRQKRKKLIGFDLVGDFFQRGFFLLGLGFLITLFTLLFFPAYPIWFGVLHFIGLASILSIFVVTRPKVGLGLGLAILGLWGLGWLGAVRLPDFLIFFPVDFSTFDYFPLVPWLGVLWVGVFLGHRWYPQAVTIYPNSFVPLTTFGNWFMWLGRHSLLVYLCHQPILVGFLLLALHAGL